MFYTKRFESEATVKFTATVVDTNEQFHELGRIEAKNRKEAEKVVVLDERDDEEEGDAA